MRNRLFSVPGCLALVGLFLLAGCKSPTPPPGVDNLAWVEVPGTFTLLEVARATSDIFQEAGYQPVPQPTIKAGQDPRLVFEKKGTKGDFLLYGDWGAGIWYRAKVMLTAKGSDKYIIRLDAYRVTDKGDKLMEQETKISKRGTYQELLDKVKARLAPPQATDKKAK